MSDDGTPVAIVLAWAFREWGGNETFMLATARHLPADWPVRVELPEGTDPVLLAQVEAHGLPWRAYGPPVDLTPAGSVVAKARRRWRDLLVHVALFRAARAGGPSVWHLNVFPWASTALLIAMSRRVGVVVSLHTPPDSWPPGRRRLWRARLVLLAGRRRIRFTAGSDTTAAGLADLSPRLRHLPVTPSVVDVDELAVAAGCRCPEGNLLVGVGQLIERKGVDTAVDAVGLLAGRGVTIRLVWIGEGDERRGLQHRIDEAGLTDRVELRAPAAFADRASMLAFVAGAAAYLQPSREDGLPAALIEAMGLGVPAVAAAVGSVPETVVDGSTGWLVAPDDPAGLADAVERILADPTEARELAARGRAHVLEHHDARIVAATLVRTYAELA